MRFLSPFRYPGGKSWLAPEVSRRLTELGQVDLLEPFAGGASVSLDAVASGAARSAHLVELDDGVAAVWALLVDGSGADVGRLSTLVADFSPDRDAVAKVVSSTPHTTLDLAFRTLVRNRFQHNGVMADGAGLLRSGEAGRGLASRWYPQTLCRRFAAVHELADRLTFTHGDGLAVLAGDDRRVAFVDPPYTVGATSPGARLYGSSQVDHDAVFAAVVARSAPAYLTYHDDLAVVALATRYGLTVDRVMMRTGHHRNTAELFLTFEPVSGQHLHAALISSRTPTGREIDGEHWQSEAGSARR